MKAAGVLVLGEDKILGFFRITEPKGYAIPCGKVEDGESVEDAAIREAKEETGYIVALEEGTDPFKREEGRYGVTVFLAKVIDKVEATHKEEGYPEWVEPEALIHSGPYPEFNEELLRFFEVI